MLPTARTRPVSAWCCPMIDAEDGAKAPPCDTAPETPPAASPRESQPERVYRQIKQLILDNELPPGSFVLQEELGARLGVSRTPIREALVRLEHDGLIEVRPRRGMRVLPVSIDGMREIYEVLTVLEAQAARLAAQRGVDAATLDALESAVEGMDRALETDDLDAWAIADGRYHETLTAASGNTRLTAMVATVTEQAYRVRRLTLRLRPKPSRSNDDHRALIAAIKAGDGQRAFEIHEHHRGETGRMLIALLERLHITSA
jgi:DNA-binding GntR family transcriptional regulator